MTTNDLQNLIHKVIDDLATAEERQRLAKIVREDETAAIEFEQVKQLTVTLASVPALAAPSELHAAVMSKVEIKKPSQLILDSSVFVAPRAQNQNSKPVLTSQTTFSRMETVMSEIKKGFFSSTMNKALVGGGVAAAALIAITAGGNFPSTNEDTVGTIAPAQRYRSDQNVTADVRPSAGGGAGSAQISVNTDNAAANSASSSADKSAQVSAEKSGQVSAEKSAQISAEKAGQRSADKSAQVSAEKSAQVSAEKSAQVSAEKSGQVSAEKAAQVSAEKAAQKSAEKSAQVSAEKSGQVSAEKAAQVSAEKAAQKSAEKSAQVSAENSGQVSAEKAAQVSAEKAAQKSAEKAAQVSAEKRLN